MKQPRLQRLRAAATLVVLVSVCLSCSANRPAEAPASLILENAAAYTLDPARPWVEAVAVLGEKIVYAGDTAGAERLRGRETRVLDLGGAMVLPGFQDSHMHLVTGGMELGLCSLNGLKSKDAVFNAIREYAVRHPEKGWIEGGGWELPLFPGAEPRKEELDRLVPDRPACLSAADGHSSWVNSRALEIAGITKTTPDPPGGRIERDLRTGEPSGTLREAASRLVSKHIPEATAEDYIRGLEAGQKLANRFGITSIIEASAGRQIMEAYAALDGRGELTVRVLASLLVDPQKGTSQIDDLKKMREKYRGRHLQATAAKIFADGVIESHTAALLRPYLDRPGDSGTAELEAAEFNGLAEALDAAGFQIHVHAIGDRAVRMSLDAIEAARRANGAHDLRPHITHLELIDPADYPRFRALGVGATFQALWAHRDDYISKLTEPILGAERSQRLYPIGSLARKGALIAGGSDWSVSSMNPLEAIQVGITRRAPEDPAGEAWLPEELVDIRMMLAAYTVNGACLFHQEQRRGSITVGKDADLVVLDRNLFKIPPTEIHRAEVLLTFLAGKEVYRSPQAPAGTGAAGAGPTGVGSASASPIPDRTMDP